MFLFCYWAVVIIVICGSRSRSSGITTYKRMTAPPGDTKAKLARPVQRWRLTDVKFSLSDVSQACDPA